MSDGYSYIESIFRNEYRMFLKACIAMTKDIEDAKEILSKAFYKLLIYAPKIQSRKHAQAVLNTAIKQSWIDEYKHRQKWGGVGVVSSDDNIELSDSDNLSLYPYTNQLYNIVSTLPAHYKQIIKLHYYDQLSDRQIAELLNKQIVDINNIRQHALQFLREPERIALYFHSEMRRRTIDEWEILWDNGKKPKQIAALYGVTSDEVRKSLSNRLKKKHG